MGSTQILRTRMGKSSFDAVQEEVELHGLMIDLLAEKGNTPLIIEIFYRHFA